jgi:2-polyprenyl-3-methyl-5-hydroxy-6-metoxy-1,4-benzoquinol methylase
MTPTIQTDEFPWFASSAHASHRYLFPSVLRELKALPEPSVLDLGCGNGVLTSRFAESGIAITGIDVSESGIRIAKETFPHVRFVARDLSDSLPSDMIGKFDAVVSIEVVEHLLLPRLLFARAREALLPGGTLVVTTPFHGYFKNLLIALANKSDWHWHPLRDFGHIKFFSVRTLRQLFEEQGFEVQTVARVGRVPFLAKSMVMKGKLKQ